jgi:hypothetical protein
MKIKSTFFFLLILISFSCQNKNWQHKIPKNKNLLFLNDSVISQIVKNNEVVIALNDKFLCLNNKSWEMITYYKKEVISINEIPYVFSKKNINKSLADSILKVFIKNKFWRIAESDYGCEDLFDSCFKKHTTKAEKMEFGNTCDLPSHPKLYKLSITTKYGSVQKQYLEPEIWQKCICCPKSSDRDIFIECLNAFKAAK